MNIVNYIDHTLLKATATKQQIVQLCNEAKEHQFYAVCVNSCYVKIAKDYLRDTTMKIAAVVGFPLGAIDTDSKVLEAKNSIKNGADEIDMVINIGFLKSGSYSQVLNEIKEIKKAIGGKVLKVIIETCYLNQEEIIIASKMVKEANANFVKTSTGFGSSGAELEDVRLMKEIVGPSISVKASGGIRDYDTALKFIAAGASRLGTSSGVKIVKEKDN